MINEQIIKVFKATNNKNCPHIRGGSGEKWFIIAQHWFISNF